MRIEKLDKLIHYLSGRPCSIEQAWSSIFEDDTTEDITVHLTIEELRYIDARVFNCTECGWWCIVIDRHKPDLDICRDCAKDLDQDFLNM